MGYACPVCGVPQRDGEHLANHLAFTAMLRGADHADWLDEHVPDWVDRGPADLAAATVEYAAEAEYEAVFEDTVRDAGRERGRGAGSGHDHGHGDAPAGLDVDSAAARGRGGGAADGPTREALREARRLTREMYGDGDNVDGDGDVTGGEETPNDSNDPDGSDDPDRDGTAGG